MYDFHKKRSYNNENIFLHKSFNKGQKYEFEFFKYYLNFRNLIKTIKRKGTCNNVNETSKDDGLELLECYKKEISSKKLTKQNIEKIFKNFNKHLDTSNEIQRNLQLKYEELEKKSEEYFIQNQNLIHELTKKR